MPNSPSFASDALAGKFETAAVSPAIPHVRFLDGIRGLAALYVVLHHLVQDRQGINPWIAMALSHGHAAVTIFITLSGVCLALPVVRSDVVLRGGAFRFYQKRMRRILPPYYGALVISLCFDVWSSHLPWSSHLVNTLWLRSLGTHLLLVHNLDSKTEFLLNGPLWSVATECQVYVLFPLMVLIWRRLGVGALVVLAFLVGHAVYWLNGHAGNLNYIAIFSLGVLAAYCGIKRAVPPALLMGGALAAAVLYAITLNKTSALADIAVGAGTACFIAAGMARPGKLTGLLSVRPAVWLGGFAYSLYLTQAVSLAAVKGISVWVDMSMGSAISKVAAYIAAVLLVVCCAYIFYLVLERPFITRHAQPLRNLTDRSKQWRRLVNVHRHLKV